MYYKVEKLHVFVPKIDGLCPHMPPAQSTQHLPIIKFYCEFMQY